MRKSSIFKTVVAMDYVANVGVPAVSQYRVSRLANLSYVTTGLVLRYLEDLGAVQRQVAGGVRRVRPTCGSRYGEFVYDFIVLWVEHDMPDAAHDDRCFAAELRLREFKMWHINHIQRMMEEYSNE